MPTKLSLSLFAALLFLTFSSFSQDDLLSMVDDSKTEPSKKVYATFKTVKIGNAQTVECVKKNHLDFRISHRFGNVYDATNKNAINETFQSFLGFDNASDIRISFDYGVTDNLSVGIGRSKFNRLVDGNLKWKLLSQTADFRVPVTIAFFESIGYTHMPTSLLYGGITKDFKTNELHRVNYFSQLIIASKITEWLSLEVLPGYMYRNFIRESVNANNKAEDQNGYLTLGFGGRIKVTKRLCIIGDYYYNFSKFYQNNSLAHQPLSLGIEMETGGHVFSLFYTNAGALVENNFIPSTSDSWRKGQVKFGFCIARTFAL